MPEANEQQEQWTLLQERIGYEFAQPERLAAALTHRSYAVETGATEPAESQRLEFLGDAVLGAVAAEWLVKNVPDWQEGTLTKVRSRLTNGAALARVARQIRLGACLRVGRGVEQSGGREQDSILADALEALMGAVWLDGGVGAIRKIFFRCFAEEIQTAVAAGGDDNPKGDLQECKATGSLLHTTTCWRKAVRPTRGSFAWPWWWGRKKWVRAAEPASAKPR